MCKTSAFTTTTRASLYSPPAVPRYWEVFMVLLAGGDTKLLATPFLSGDDEGVLNVWLGSHT